MRRFVLSVVCFATLSFIGVASFNIVSSIKGKLASVSISSNLENSDLADSDSVKNGMKDGENLSEISEILPQDFGAKVELGNNFLEAYLNKKYSELYFTSVEEFFASYNSLIAKIDSVLVAHPVYVEEARSTMSSYSIEDRITVFVDVNDEIYKVILKGDINLDNLVGDGYEANSESGYTIISRCD